MSGTVIKIHLTHNISGAVVVEKRYALNQTIGSIKANIATHYQTTVEGMRLDLKDLTGTTIEANMKDDKMLGYYQAREDYTIHVVQTNPEVYYNYDDLSQCEKYVMTDADYDKREGTVRAYKAQVKAAKEAEMRAQGIPIPEELGPDSFKEEAEKMKVGDRCQCQPGDRLGTVRYVGRIVSIKPGFFIGVEFDEPVGKGDGTAKGATIFECRPNYGGFLRPDQVAVGDYPPEEF
eukprot:GILI01013303.1.p1 GENE.GILI01013303.1~~GILI01013303.1.p1  ORF type:complete len:234 (+),score=67.57 GILI01013303.1:93-794(+)